MRLLALADELPRASLRELVARNAPDALVTLGDLPEEGVAELADLRLPRLGVHGNHDEPGMLDRLGVADVHLAGEEVGGWSFAGFEGCVRYGRGGVHQYTQRKAARLVRRLPPADVLLCHCPPSGVNDNPEDPAHVGFEALREWVERHAPRYLLHGHTTPDPRTRVHRLGATRVVWVRGATSVVLQR
jgi:Icc-related predicted phosphoesterase